MKKETKIKALAELENASYNLIDTWNHILAFGKLLENDLDKETKNFIDEVLNTLLEEFKDTYKRIKS